MKYMGIKTKAIPTDLVEMAKFILFPSNQLQRHVTVFLRRIACTLILIISSA